MSYEAESGTAKSGNDFASLDLTETEKARARIAWLEETKAWLEKAARLWQDEAERLRDIESRFENYFRETQAWIASLEEAKQWQENQTEFWRRKAEGRD